MIPTVLLPVAADAVAGTCSSREELLHKTTTSMTAFHENSITLASLCEARSSGDADRFRLFSLDEGVQELASLKDAGGGLLVECSTAADGRDPSGLAEISRRSGLEIVLGASCQQVQLDGCSVCGAVNVFAAVPKQKRSNLPLLLNL